MDLWDRIYKNLIYDGRYKLVLGGLENTLIIAVFACVIGCFLGIFICSLRTSKIRAMCVFAKIYILFFRNIPIVLLLMLTYYVVFANSGFNARLISIFTFSIYHSAYLAEIFRSGLNSINTDQIEASNAIGFTETQRFLFVILPQTVRVIFPAYKGEFITMIKLTSIVGYIGVRDLMRSIDIVRSQTFDALLPLVLAVIMYFIIIGFFTFALNLLEKVINPRKA